MAKQIRPRLSEAEHKAYLTKVKKEGSGNKRYIVLGCVHVPFHNKALSIAITELMKVESFDGVVLAGDFLDMNALGQYDRGKVSKTGITLEDEYQAGREALSFIESALPSNAEKVFMWGNHEARYWRWKADIDNSKYGDILNPTKALKLKDRGWKVYDNYEEDVHYIGSLGVMHGEYYNIHCAKKHLDVFRRNTLFFHTHRMQMHREGDFAAYNGGFLGDITSPAFSYAKRGMKSAWGNGFAIVTLDKDGQHHVDLVSCINDKFCYGGEVYGGKLAQ